MSKKALIVWGGWAGHQPKEVGQIFERVLKEDGFEVEVSDTLDAFKDEAKLMGLNLIVPIWTMGKITNEQANPVFKAVREGGVGIAGCHGGMCDAFRENTEWQFMTGGQWVAHPGNCIPRYRVQIRDTGHPITRGLSDFDLVDTEQYYVHTDPGNHVLTTTTFSGEHGDTTLYSGGTVMPYAWTKHWGKGKVFVACWGHTFKDFDVPEAREIVKRGIVWASR